MNRAHKTFEIGISFLVLIIFIVSGEYIWSSIGLAFTAYIFLRFFFDVSHSIDIRNLIILMPVIQWVMGPWLAYNFSTDEDFYFMMVDEEVYMQFAVPSILAYSIGLFAFIKHQDLNISSIIQATSKFLQRNKNVDYYFVIVGIILYATNKYLPSQLAYIGFLLGNLHFIGVFFIAINPNRKQKPLLISSILFIALVLSINQALFHTLILWFIFIFLIFSAIKKTTTLKKIIIISSMIVFAIILQSIKQQFRAVIWSEKGSEIGAFEKTNLLFELANERVATEGYFESESNINNMISRINQGWIIARVLYHVPYFEPYAEGETIYSGLISTLVPRIIWATKEESGGKSKFTRFTGRKLEKGTSMNISILGESYANFGANGSLFFMFFFGILLNYSYAFLKKKIIKKPLLLFFIPIIYLQVIKAETDFVTVLNHLVKAGVFVFILFWGMNKFLNIRL